MFNDATILRLIISQAFAAYYLLILIPIKKPIKQNMILFMLGALFITSINALIIIYLGISFYIRFYFITLLLPYIILLLYVAVNKGAKLVFALLTTQVVGNVAIINGLLASYVFYGENNPLIDTVARILTYIIFLPIIIIYIKPTYLKMVKLLNKGWWIINSALIMSYVLAYYILFVPDDIFSRSEYFIHGYIGIFLSLLIYAIIYFLFIEVQIKSSIEYDKQLLSTQVTSLAAQSVEISNIAYKDTLTGLSNRYSLLKKMDKLIQKQDPFMLVFIDLDNLKVINDGYSHAQGDIYLRQFAIATKNAIKSKGEVFRYAGDEFVCLVTEDVSHFNIEIFKNTIAKEMTNDMPYYGFSIGLSSYPGDALNTEDLISFADQAMYQEKKTKTKKR